MGNRRGFTLVELLITSALLAMLGATCYAVLSAGTRAAAKTRRRTRMIACGQRALDVMAGEIRTAVEHNGTRLTALDARYEGRDTDTIDFIAPRMRKTRAGPGEGARCEVGYYIDSDPETEAEWLVRREDATVDDDPLEGGWLTPAGPYVSELDLQFYDGFEWVDGWEDSRRFPPAVRIAIVVVDPDEVESATSFQTTVSIPAR